LNRELNHRSVVVHFPSFDELCLTFLSFPSEPVKAQPPVC
jgi:hypothetical protein